MSVKSKILEAAEQLAKAKPYDQITFAEIAEMAGVHWTAVRRHLGSKQEMRIWLQEKQTGLNGSLSDTKSRILEAAGLIFSEHGYRNASLDKVAAAAGMTKGAVYWHFANKQDLYLAIIERNLQQQSRQLPLQIDQILGADDPETALYLWLQSQFDCIGEGDGRALLFYEFVTSSREPEIRNKLKEMYGKALDGLGSFLAETQRNGYIEQGLDPHYIGIMVDGLIKGIVIEWIIDPERCQLEPLMRTMSKVLWNGLRPKK